MSCTPSLRPKIWPNKVQLIFECLWYLQWSCFQKELNQWNPRIWFTKTVVYNWHSFYVWFNNLKVTSSSKAEKAGIAEGLLVRSINSANCEDWTHSDALNSIKRTGSVLKLVLSRWVKKTICQQAFLYLINSIRSCRKVSGLIVIVVLKIVIVIIQGPH